jgi:hypothetical protein
VRGELAENYGDCLQGDVEHRREAPDRIDGTGEAVDLFCGIDCLEGSGGG